MCFPSDVARAASPGFADGFNQWHSGLLDFTGNQGLYWPLQLSPEFRDGSPFGGRQPAVEHIPVKAEESIDGKPDRDSEPVGELPINPSSFFVKSLSKSSSS